MPCLRHTRLMRVMQTSSSFATWANGLWKLLAMFSMSTSPIFCFCRQCGELSSPERAHTSVGTGALRCGYPAHGTFDNQFTEVGRLQVDAALEKTAKDNNFNTHSNTRVCCNDVNSTLLLSAAQWRFSCL